MKKKKSGGKKDVEASRQNIITNRSLPFSFVERDIYRVVLVYFWRSTKAVRFPGFVSFVVQRKSNDQNKFSFLFKKCTTHQVNFKHFFQVYESNWHIPKNFFKKIVFSRVCLLFLSWSLSFCRLTHYYLIIIW